MTDRPLTVRISPRTIVGVTALIALAWAFVSVRGVLMTVFLAVFAALVLDPPVRAVQRRLRVGRGAATAFVMVTLLVLVLGAGAVLVAPLVDAVRAFADALPDVVRGIRDSQAGRWIDERSDVGELAQAHAQEIGTGIASAAGGALGVATSTFGLLLSGITAAFMTLFLLLDLPRLVRAVDSLLTPAASERWGRVSGEIMHTISRTMLASVTLAVTCGVTYGVAAWALGAPYPVALGVIAGFLDLVPMVGATLAGVIVVLVTLTEGLFPAVIMLAIVLVYQQVENHVLQPVVVGRAARVSGFFVLVSVLIFGALFGIAGVLIAVPLSASIRIALREVTAERRQAMAALRREARPVPIDAGEDEALTDDTATRGGRLS